jgi:hypothetical protein
VELHHQTPNLKIDASLDLVEEEDASARVLLTKVRPTRSARDAREGLEAQGLPIMATEVRLLEAYAAAVDAVPRDLGEYEDVLAELQTVGATR